MTDETEEDSEGRVKVRDRKCPAYLGITLKKWMRLKEEGEIPEPGGRIWAGPSLEDFWWSTDLDEMKERLGRRYKIEGKDAMQKWGTGRRTGRVIKKGREVPLVSGERIHIEGLDDVPSYVRRRPDEL